MDKDLSPLGSSESASVGPDCTTLQAQVDRARDVAILRARLETLPEELRIPLLLHQVEGLSAKQIAARLRLSEEVVYNRVAEGLARLHIALRSTKKR